MNENTKYLRYLKVMKIACQDILEHTEGRTFDDFVAAKAERQATNLNLLIIGETANKIINLNMKSLDPSFLEELRKAKGLRNVVAHEYHVLELESVYRTATESITPFLEKVISMENLIQINRPEQDIER